MIHVLGFRTAKKDFHIDTTSRSKTWSRGLSPFFVGPIQVNAQDVSVNMENAWQYSKVFVREHVGNDGHPNEKWWEWARAGWAKERADRYPMGKSAVPFFSWAFGQRLPYVQARKSLYAPWYAKAVQKTDAFARLKKEYETNKDIWLWDFDGYDHHKLGMSYLDVINCPDKKMGHAFVLAMLLEGQRVWEDE